MIDMATSKNKSIITLLNRFRKNRIERLINRLYWRKKETDIKNEMRNDSHSLLWVWEFSKKAVLICFMFYIAVQVYSMVVMVIYCDFTNLGDLINQTGEIVRDCVFAYLIKAGIENTGKIISSRYEYKCQTSCDDNDDSVG